MRTLKYAILGMLSHHELTGYDIMKEFDRGLANFWYASHRQLYPELKRLAGEGLIQCETSIKGESLERRKQKLAFLQTSLEQAPPFADAFDAAMGDRLILEGAVMREQTMVEWLEHCIETMEHCKIKE